MPFTNQASSVQPGRFRGVDASGLAQLLAHQNDGLARGFSVLGEAVKALGEKQKKQDQQSWMAGLGDRIGKATTKETRPAFEYLDDYAYLGDKEVTEMMADPGPAGPDGPPGPSKPQIIQKSGLSQWYEKMRHVDLATHEKEAMYRMLTSPRERSTIDEGAMHQILAEGFELGISPQQVQSAIETYSSGASVGAADMREDLRKELKAAGFGPERVKVDGEHPLGLEIRYAATEQEGQNAMLRHMWTVYGIGGPDALAMLPAAMMAVANNSTGKGLEDALGQLMGRQITRQQEIAVQTGGIAPDSFRGFENAEALKRDFDPFAVFERDDAETLKGELEMYGEKSLTLYGDGQWKTATPRLTETLNAATAKLAPGKRAALMKHLLQDTNPMYDAPAGVGRARVGPYAHPGQQPQGGPGQPMPQPAGPNAGPAGQPQPRPPAGGGGRPAGIPDWMAPEFFPGVKRDKYIQGRVEAAETVMGPDWKVSYHAAARPRFTARNRKTGKGPKSGSEQAVMLKGLEDTNNTEVEYYRKFMDGDAPAPRGDDVVPFEARPGAEDYLDEATEDLEAIAPSRTTTGRSVTTAAGRRIGPSLAREGRKIKRDVIDPVVSILKDAVQLKSARRGITQALGLTEIQLPEQTQDALDRGAPTLMPGVPSGRPERDDSEAIRSMYAGGSEGGVDARHALGSNSGGFQGETPMAIEDIREWAGVSSGRRSRRSAIDDIFGIKTGGRRPQIKTEQDAGIRSMYAGGDGPDTPREGGRRRELNEILSALKKSLAGRTRTGGRRQSRPPAGDRRTRLLELQRQYKEELRALVGRGGS